MSDEKPVWINIGCLDNFKEGFINVDKIAFSEAEAERYNARTMDLNFPWLFADSSADYILALDIIEHLHDKTFTMNEAWRVLKPGGILEILVPVTDGPGAFQDPTHHTYWNRNSFFYYEKGNPHRVRFGKAYGIKAEFEIVKEEKAKIDNDIPMLHIILRAVK